MPYTAFDRFVASRRFRAVRPHIRPDTRVCDIGCGSDASFLQSLGSRIRFGVGLDDHVDQSHSNAVYLVRADIARGLPIAGAQFDHVVMLAVLEHLREPQNVLREAFRILSPGGTLVLTWPSGAVDPILWVLCRVRLVHADLGFEQHQPRIPLGELTGMLTHIGFRLIRHGRFELGLNNWLLASKPC